MHKFSKIELVTNHLTKTLEDYLKLKMSCDGVYTHTTKKEDENSLFSSIIVKSFLWGIGYLCMWFSKWIIASVIMKKNIILEAIDRIFLRTGNTTLTFENITFSKVITENFNNIPKKLLLAFLLFYVVIIIIFE